VILNISIVVVSACFHAPLNIIHVPNVSRKLSDNEQNAVDSAADETLAKLGSFSPAKNARERRDELSQLGWQGLNLVFDGPCSLVEEMREGRVLSALAVVMKAPEQALQILARELVAEVDDVHSVGNRL
jgi:hypothetical protein